MLAPTKLELEEGPNKRTRLLITLNNAQVTQRAGNVLVAGPVSWARRTFAPGA